MLGSNPEIDIYEDRQGDSMSIVGHILNTVEGLQKEFLVNGSALDTYDGTPERDYVHLKDITDANIKAMQAILENKISFDLINIGSGIKTSVLRLISEFEKNAQKKISLKYVSLPSNEIPTSSANIQKATELLDWSPKRDIKNIVEDCMKDTKYI